MGFDTELMKVTILFRVTKNITVRLGTRRRVPDHHPRARKARLRRFTSESVCARLSPLALSFTNVALRVFAEDIALLRALLLYA
jgi:hypothetical protein